MLKAENAAVVRSFLADTPAGADRPCRRGCWLAAEPWTGRDLRYARLPGEADMDRSSIMACLGQAGLSVEFSHSVGRGSAPESAFFRTLRLDPAVLLATTAAQCEDHAGRPRDAEPRLARTSTSSMPTSSIEAG